MRADISTDRGEQLTLNGQVTKGGVGYPVDFTGFQVRFAAYVTPALPIVLKTIGSGVAVSANGNYTISILRADTEGLSKATLWDYDVTLIEPDGTETVAVSGTWRIGEAAST